MPSTWPPGSWYARLNFSDFYVSASVFGIIPILLASLLPDSETFLIRQKSKYVYAITSFPLVELYTLAFCQVYQ